MVTLRTQISKQKCSYIRTAEYFRRRFYKMFNVCIITSLKWCNYYLNIIWYFSILFYGIISFWLYKITLVNKCDNIILVLVYYGKSTRNDSDCRCLVFTRPYCTFCGPGKDRFIISTFICYSRSNIYGTILISYYYIKLRNSFLTHNTSLTLAYQLHLWP